MTGKIITAIIVVAIVIYAIAVVVKKFNNIRKGKYCSTPFVPTPSGIHSQFHLVLRQKWTVLETPP